MARRKLGLILWVGYITFLVLWIFILPSMFPQIRGFGYFFPFFFFFPFFGRGRRSRPRPAQTDRGGDTAKESGRQEEEWYGYDNMLADTGSSRTPRRNYLLYIAGAAVLVIGIGLLLARSIL